MNTHNDTWKAKYRNATQAQIDWALKDIKEALDIWREHDTDYTRKLWSEWDYLIVKKGRTI